ncbi:MAG: hypothetical protein KGL39_16480 [Patescibacteria group bacterium]|nr:hypothetical protein [Patescibacteria group bacterium]
MMESIHVGFLLDPVPKLKARAKVVMALLRRCGEPGMRIRGSIVRENGIDIFYQGKLKSGWTPQKIAEEANR